MQSDFFITYQTAGAENCYSYFGREHLSWLAGGAVFILLAVIIYRAASAKGRRGILIALASLIVADECAKHIFLLAIGMERVDYLPLHLCSIGLIWCVIYAAHPNKLCGEFLYAVCLPGALAALLFPGWSFLPIGSFISIHSFTYHIFLAAFPTVLLVSGEVRPSLKRLPVCAVILAVMCVPIWFVNKKFDTNFFFLNYAGEGNPLSLFDDLLGEPWYIVGLPVIAVIVWTVMYLPFVLTDRRKKARAAQNGND